MLFRIKVRETVGWRTYYIPQYRKYFLWMDIWYNEYFQEEDAMHEIIKIKDQLEYEVKRKTKRIYYK